MTYDAGIIHSYIAAGRAGDWQSPLMTTVWGLIDPIAPGAGSMFLLMAVLYWLAFAVLGLKLSRHSPWLGPVSVPLGLAPPAFVFVGIIWRDVLFAGAWLLGAALAFTVAERRDSWRIAAQAIAVSLLVFGFLLRLNSLFAAPVLAAYLLWPARFEIKRAAVYYVPMVAFLAILQPVVYYGILDAEHQHSEHMILVFDLGGITHFTKSNQFPKTWSADEAKLLTETCYRPSEWDVYFIGGQCSFVMEKLGADKIFGSPVLVEAWRRAVLAHPYAYLRHRVAFMANFLTKKNLTMWTFDVTNPDRDVFPDNRWFNALRSLHDQLATTPLFRTGVWLLLCIACCALAWRRRFTPPGAFVIGCCGSAVVYMATFFPVGVASDFRFALWAVLASVAGTVVLSVGLPRSDMDNLIRGLRGSPGAGPAWPRVALADAEDRIKVDAKPAQGAEGRFKSEASISAVRQGRWGWIGAIAAVLIAAYFGAHYIGIPVPWPGSAASVAEAEAKRRVYEEAAQRDPASVKPGSGESFIDRLADGQPCLQCPEMVVVPDGKFPMGSPAWEDGHTSSETQVPVTIAQPFAVGKFAVTFDQWDACVADGGCNGHRPNDRGWGRGNRPVINVIWDDANAYAEWLSRKTGKTYRLLSEAQREYVTRAGTTTAFWWGPSITRRQANYATPQTVPVDSFEANPWGLFNVHGNVWEWTADCWNNSNQGNPGDGSARTTGNCSQHVIRGGSWSTGPDLLRAACRAGWSKPSSDVGFRLARTLNP
jgi:formylglycine-generating enzyme required for sulfatase activity